MILTAEGAFDPQLWRSPFTQDFGIWNRVELSVSFEFSYEHQFYPFGPNNTQQNMGKHGYND